MGRGRGLGAAAPRAGRDSPAHTLPPPTQHLPPLAAGSRFHFPNTARSACAMMALLDVL